MLQVNANVAVFMAIQQSADTDLRVMDALQKGDTVEVGIL